MTPQRFLPKLERAARRRLARIRNVAMLTTTLPPSVQREAYMAYVVLEVISTWSNFMRALYLSLVLSPRTAMGVRISISVVARTYDDALGHIIPHYRPRARPLPTGSWHRRDEPAWHDPNVFLNGCMHLGCSHVNHFGAAFSAGSAAFLHLPVFRNYYAHRNDQTLGAAMSIAPGYGIAWASSPTEALLSFPLAWVQPLLVQWLDDVDFTVEYLCI
jgi:hypothetical protein